MGVLERPGTIRISTFHRIYLMGVGEAATAPPRPFNMTENLYINPFTPEKGSIDEPYPHG